jgi:translation initiation factor 4A
MEYNTNSEPYNFYEKNKTEFVNCFHYLHLKESLLKGINNIFTKGIYEYGFEKPSKIQKLILPNLINTDRDLIIQADSGTGKTASCIIGSLQKLDELSQVTQVLILCPTIELAQSVSQMYKNLSCYLNIKLCTCIGGVKLKETLNELKNNPQIVIGTPGRCLDIVKKGYLDISRIKLFILDEADEMLARGFNKINGELFQFLGKDIRKLMFSATIPTELRDIYHSHFSDPLLIKCKPEQYTLDGVKQYYIKLKEEWKLEALIEVLNSNIDVSQTIIYCNRKKTVDFLTEKLSKQNLTFVKYYGELSQVESDNFLNQFKNGNVRILVTTDFYLREIDEKHLLINYELQSNFESYIARIGRRSRWGVKMIAISFVTPGDELTLEEIQKYYSTIIEELPLDLEQL